MKHFVKVSLKEWLLTSLFLGLIFVSPCFAEKGIYQPKVSPDEIMSDRLPAEIIVTAEIGDVPPRTVDVKIYQTTESGEPLRILCPMQVNLNIGGFYQGQFTINDKKDKDFFIKIAAVYDGKEQFFSPVQKVAIYDPLPSGIADGLTKVMKDLENNFKEYLKTHDVVTARKMVLKNAQNNPDIAETGASLNGRNLSILYKNRIRGIVWLDDPKMKVDGLQ